MQTIYQNGTVVSVPDLPYRPTVKRSTAPSKKCFGVNFKTKMKIFDAAHIQHLELSNAMRFTNPDTGEIYNANHNHVFLTPTFDEKDINSYLGKAANEALKRFTDNLTKRYDCTSYVWVKEFTKKLVPHYHMLVTIPRVAIVDLNRAWSTARGDLRNCGNALRTGWDSRRKKPIMKVKSYKAAVGYAAKYITKANSGDISVLKTSCKLADRKTWEFRTGHSTKCYGMSQNLHREPRQLDLFHEFHYRPWLTKQVKEVKGQHCELYFFDNWSTANLLFEKAAEKDQKVEILPEIIKKKNHYKRSDQLIMSI